MPDQVPDERQARAPGAACRARPADRRRAERRARRARRGGARRGIRAAPTPALLRGRTRRNTTVNFAGAATPGELVDVLIEGSTLDDAQGHRARRGRSVKRPPHRVVRPDRDEPRAPAPGRRPRGLRRSTSARTRWTRRVPLPPPGSLGPLPGVSGRDRRRRVPRGRPRRPSRRAREGAPARPPSRTARSRTLMMTFNVLEYCRQRSSRSSSPRRARSTATSTASRATRRRPPTSPSRRARTRRRRSRARRSSTRTRAATGCDYLVFRFSNVYGRYDNDLHRMARVLPLFIHRISARRADHGLRRRGEGARLHLRRRLRRRDRARDRGSGGRARRERDDQPRLRRGNTLVRAAELIARRARRRAADRRRAVAARRGDALRRRHPQGARPARLGAADARSTRASRRGRVVPGARAAHPEEDRLVESEGAGAGWKTLATEPALDARADSGLGGLSRRPGSRRTPNRGRRRDALGSRDPRRQRPFAHGQGVGSPRRGRRSRRSSICARTANGPTIRGASSGWRCRRSLRLVDG